MIFANLKQFFNKNKKNLFYVGIFILAFFVLSDLAFAGDSTTPPNPEEPKEEKDSLITWLNGFFRIIAAVIGLLTQLVGVFITPDWTNGNIIGIQDKIKQLWILVSNVVYFIFAVLLIVIAFMNIIGKGEKWELKQALPKFTIGVLIVPFSWFFVQFVVSISSIFAASVLSLPFDTLAADIKTKTVLDETKVCVDVVIKKDEAKCKSEDKKKSLSQIMEGKGMYGLMNVYTYGIFRVDEYSVIHKKDLVSESVTTIFDLAVDKIFHIILIIVYVILVITLALALFTRIMWLWLYMIFSPVFGLLFFFGKENEGIMDGKFSITQFIGLALVPAYVSAALSFGLLFIFVAGQGIGNTTNKADAIVSFGEVENSKPVQSYMHFLPGSKDWGGFKITYEGGNDGNELTEVNNSLKGFEGSLGLLLLQLFGLAILWISVLTAMKASKVTEQVVQPIADFGKQVGGLIAKSPQYAPVFGGQSMSSLQRAGSTFSGAVEGKVNEKGVAFGNKFAEQFGVGGSDLQELNNIINSTSKNALQSQSAMKKYFGKLDNAVDIDKMSVNDSMKKRYLDALELAGVKVDGHTDQFMAAKSGAHLSTVIADMINKQEGGIVKSTLQEHYGSSQSAVRRHFAGEKATQVAGDVTRGSFDDFSEIKGSERNLPGDIKIKMAKADDADLKGRIFKKDSNGNGGSEYTFNFQQTNASAVDVHDATDKKEFIELYRNVLNSDKAALEEALSTFKFTNVGALANKIVEYANEGNSSNSTSQASSDNSGSGSE